jgi:NADH dehydrogenase [ubiquinone] flavoprotein 3, mitochondrial
VTKNVEREVPGTGQQYQVPEYFGFNRMSFSEAEVEMQNFRITQPVAPRK